jgi:hypothetical protein
MEDLLARYRKGTYPYDAILLQVAADFNHPQLALTDYVEKWNREFAYPRLRLAAASEFFRHMEGRHSSTIPHLRGAFPDSWNDQRATMA